MDLLATPIEKLPRIGAFHQAKLKKLGIESVRDLLYHFPHRYEDLSQVCKIKDLALNQSACIHGEIVKIKTIRTWKKKMFITEAVVKDETGVAKVVWFNQPYLSTTLKPGDLVAIAGKFADKGREAYFSSPTYEKLGTRMALESGPTHTGRLVPVYWETEGITSRWFRFIIKPLLEKMGNISDPLPAAALNAYEFMPLTLALNQIHFPESMEMADAARKRLAFEELFFIHLAVMRERQRLRKEKAQAIKMDVELIKQFLESLPFELTGAQKKSLYQILTDLEHNYPMNRLMQGDVGSGKTVVAAAAALVAAKAGWQTAVMAPTEILSRQHFETLSKLFTPFNIEVGLLCSKACGLSTYGKVKKDAVINQTASGDVKVLIGTSALIQKGIKFHNLALVILDEQHHFGVDQRATLAKANDAKIDFVPHLLSMTATPIPRSLSLTLYGDLDLSLLDEMPPGRLKVETRIVLPQEQPAAYEFLRQEIKSGRQVFVICPRIEPENKDLLPTLFDSFGSKEAVKAVKEEYEKLSTKVFPELSVAMLHGKMKSAEKQEIMKAFEDKKTDILVSTSVIEVGIDIPNASIMVIEGAEKFGLAQLHQFRGRVGRGVHQSYCLLFADKPTSYLKAMVNCDNGFELAQKDLAIRGPGEVMGQKQSGIPDLVMASLADTKLVESSRAAAKGVLTNDPNLSKHPQLRSRIADFNRRTHLE